MRCGATASFATDALKGRARVIQVWIRPGAAVPMVVSSPIPPVTKGLRNWNVRLFLVLLVALMIVIVAGNVA